LLTPKISCTTSTTGARPARSGWTTQARTLSPAPAGIIAHSPRRGEEERSWVAFSAEGARVLTLAVPGPSGAPPLQAASVTSEVTDKTRSRRIDPSWRERLDDGREGAAAKLPGRERSRKTPFVPPAKPFVTRR
jgi:hypothetical protein